MSTINSVVGGVGIADPPSAGPSIEAEHLVKRYGETVAVAGVSLFMPVIMFSTFWAPASFMPGWYETVATWNPFPPTLDAARSIMLGTTDWSDVGIGLGLLGALAVVTYGLAGRHYAAATSAD